MKILDWVKHLGGSFLFLDELEIYRSASLDVENNILGIRNEYFPLVEFHSTWIRRPFSLYMTDLYQYLRNNVDIDVAGLLVEETSSITRYLYDFLSRHSTYFLANSSWLGTNKLVEIKMAKDAGLRVPVTLVTTSKEETACFIRQVGKCIVKSLYNARVIHPYNVPYEMYTSRLSDRDISALPDTFAPSMIQQEILKEYEIRSFFLDGEIFSMGILPERHFYDVEVDCRKFGARLGSYQYNCPKIFVLKYESLCVS